VLTVRNLVHIRREPLQLSDVTVRPVLFTLLFTWVFGAGIVLPHNGSYSAFAIAGLLALNLTTSSMGTAVGLSNDLTSGAIDRFRTLPTWRPAVLTGHSLADLLTAPLCATIVAQHPVTASVLWPVAILLVFAPLAALLFRAAHHRVGISH